MAAEEKEVKKKSFLVYYDNQVIVRHLTDDEAGKLFKALFPYAADAVKPDFEDNQALAMAFDVLRIAIDRDKEKYIKKCESNRKNIEKRWNKKNTIEYERIHSYTKDTDKDMDNDRDKDMDNDMDNDRDNINITNYQEIVSMYNETCVSLPKVSKLSEKRKKAIKARLKIYTLDDFKKMFKMAEESDFLKGKNSKNWLATFDWLICDSNMAKVLDGNYANRGSSQQGEPAKEWEKPDYYQYLGRCESSPDDPFQ